MEQLTPIWLFEATATLFSQLLQPFPLSKGFPSGSDANTPFCS